MIFTVPTKDLADAVNFAVRAVPAKPPTPILAGMFLIVENGTLRMEGFDYEQSASAEAPLSSTDGDGRVLVAGHLLAAIVRALPGAETKFDVDPTGSVKVTSGKAKFTLRAIPDGDYPSMPSMPKKAGELPADQFAAAVRRVSNAASRDQAVPLLSGVQIGFQPSEGKLTLIATDRYRLAKTAIPYTPADPAADPFTVVVPARVLDSASKSMPTGTITLYGEAGEAQPTLGFGGDGRTSTSRILSGQYPAVERVIPTDESLQHNIGFDRGEFIAAANRVALVAEPNAPILVAVNGGTITLSAGTGENANATEEMPCDYDGTDQFTIGFRPQYITDALGNCETSQATLQLAEPGKPTIVRQIHDPKKGKDDNPDAGKVDDSYTYLIMPVRI